MDEDGSVLSEWGRGADEAPENILFFYYSRFIHFILDTKNGISGREFYDDSNRSLSSWEAEGWIISSEKQMFLFVLYVRK